MDSRTANNSQTEITVYIGGYMGKNDEAFHKEFSPCSTNEDFERTLKELQAMVHNPYPKISSYGIRLTGKLNGKDILKDYQNTNGYEKFLSDNGLMKGLPYIKLAFNLNHYKTVDFHGCIAVLKSKPEIISGLPYGVQVNRAGQAFKQYKDQISGVVVSTESFHDCKGLSEKQINEVLEKFASHYDNYKTMPDADLYGENELIRNLYGENELIRNIDIAINNVRDNTSIPFLWQDSCKDGEELYIKATY